MASRGNEKSSGTNSPSRESPEEFLRRFFGAMQKWEEDASRRDQEAMVSENEMDPELSDRAYDESFEDLRRIFREFCTTEEPGRGLQYEEPPEYNPEEEKILEVRPVRGGVKIVTEQTSTLGYHHKLVYTLVERPDGWRLKDHRVYLNEDGSEEPMDL